jgi:putative oxidoreductase
MKYVLLLGRVLFSSIFIMKSFCHFSGEAIARSTELGVPAAPFLVPLAGLLALLGGLSILLGYKAKIGAWLLVIFLLPITFVMHRFWEVKDGHLVLLQHLCFIKNVSLLGASLMIAYFGSGPLSLSKQAKTK